MDVVVVRGVVDGLKEPLELTGGPTVHNQNEGDAHRRRRGGVSRVLVPLDIHISLTWMWKKNMLTQKKTHPRTTDSPFQRNRIHSLKLLQCMLGAHIHSHLSLERSGGAKSASLPRI